MTTAPPSHTLPSQSVLDREIMKLSFGDDRTFACDTMRIYMRDAPMLAEKALAAIRQGDNEAMAVNAHALKGITSYFNRGEMYQLCLTIEHLGRDSALPLQSVHALGTWSQMNAGLTEMLAAMKQYLNEE